MLLALLLLLGQLPCLSHKLLLEAVYALPSLIFCLEYLYYDWSFTLCADQVVLALLCVLCLPATLWLTRYGCS